MLELNYLDFSPILFKNLRLIGHDIFIIKNSICSISTEGNKKENFLDIAHVVRVFIIMNLTELHIKIIQHKA